MQLCFLGEFFFDMPAVSVTAFSSCRGTNYYSIQFEQVSVPSQEAIHLPFVISGKLTFSHTGRNRYMTKILGNYKLNFFLPGWCITG